MKIKSFGKINLNLRVLDELVNGLHKIESLIVPIDLYDVIEIKEIKNDKDIMQVVYGMENGAPIESKLSNIKLFSDMGINYITLAHSKSNHISDSSYDENKNWGGLSPFGREVVAEMNKQGAVSYTHLTLPTKA